MQGLSPDAFTDWLAARCVPPAVYGGVDVARNSIIRQRVVMAGLPPQSHKGVTRPVGLILYFRDVSQESELAQHKSEFLVTAAHELRTPMASVLGFSELLLEKEYDAAKRKEFIAIIHRQSVQMVSIINELLDLARIEAREGRDFKCERVALQDVLQDLVGNFAPPSGRDPPEIRWPDTPLYVMADADKLFQALLNILGNAYKYSPHGGPVQVAVLQTQPDQVCIRITDHGLGMTPQQLKNVFTRFYRADTMGALPGSGLGMNIAKQIIDLLQGQIVLESQPDQGTAVSVILPYDSSL